MKPVAVVEMEVEVEVDVATDVLRQFGQDWIGPGHLEG